MASCAVSERFRHEFTRGVRTGRGSMGRRRAGGWRHRARCRFRERRPEVGAVVLHLGTAGTGGVLTSTEKVDEGSVSEGVPLKHLEELRELTVEELGEHDCLCAWSPC